MTKMRDEFLSEEDLDLRNLAQEELIVYWNLWLEQAQEAKALWAGFCLSQSVNAAFREGAKAPRSIIGRPLLS